LASWAARGEVAAVGGGEGEMGLLSLMGRGIFVRGRFRSRGAGDSRSRGLTGQSGHVRTERGGHVDACLPSEY
jgi:hypothetical protein